MSERHRLVAPSRTAPDSLSEAWAADIANAVTRTNRSVRRSIDGTVVPLTAPGNRKIVRTWLYEDVHLRGALPMPRAARIAPGIRAALTQHWCSPGWRLIGSRGDQQIVENGHGLSLVVPPRALERGAESGLSIRVPRLRENVAPGWHSVTSLAGPVNGAAVRLYLSAWPESSFVSLIRGLDRLDVAWTAKWATDAASVRPDSAVVYINPSASGQVLRVVDRVDPGETSTIPGFSARRGAASALGGSVPAGRSASFGSLVADVAADAILRDADIGEELRGLAAELLREWS